MIKKRIKIENESVKILRKSEREIQNKNELVTKARDDHWPGVNERELKRNK